MNSLPNVCVIGLGYIGLPTATVLASRGFKVVGVDVSEEVVETVNSGGIHIVEPDLDVAVRAAVFSGQLQARTKPAPADVFIVAVPTPFTDGKKADLSYIENAAKSIAPELKQGDLVILESTSPVGSTEMLSKWLALERADLKFPHENSDESDILVAHCPERVLPGKIMIELITNDRVIGGLDEKSAASAADFYRNFVRGECIETDARTAEMAKLTENTFRDVNIAFANELSVICDELDINVWELIAIANRHPRVTILNPGIGVGGHCIAVDPWFIVDRSPEQAKMTRLAREINDEKPNFVIQKIHERAAAISTRKLVCCGLAFKPNVDDLRESPAMSIVRILVDHGYEITVVEPNISELPSEFRELKSVVLANGFSELQNDSLVCVLVGHREFEDFLNTESELAIIDFTGLSGH